MKGLKYIHIHTPCPSGWGIEERLSVKLGKLAVETGLYVLYEIEDGEMKLSPPSARLLTKKKVPPVSDYLGPQSRFKALPEAAIENLQQEVDAKWETYRSQMM